MKSDLEWFKETFDCDDPTRCWVRRGSQFSKWDYDSFTVDGVQMGAHRSAWILFKGPIPDGMSVCHDCENAPCVNHAHLFLGTFTDNRRDWVSKGKRKKPPCAVTTRNVEITAISLTAEIMKEGRLRAKTQRRSFSNYVQVLIESDLSKTKQPACPCSWR